MQLQLQADQKSAFYVTFTTRLCLADGREFWIQTAVSEGVEWLHLLLSGSKGMIRVRRTRDTNAHATSVAGRPEILILCNVYGQIVPCVWAGILDSNSRFGRSRVEPLAFLWI